MGLQQLLNNWEVERVTSLLEVLVHNITTGPTDRAIWRLTKDGSFTVNNAYRREIQGGGRGNPYNWNNINIWQARSDPNQSEVLHLVSIQKGLFNLGSTSEERNATGPQMLPM